MGEFVKLNPDSLKVLREVNPMMMSYNVEFAEVTVLYPGANCRNRRILCRTNIRRNCCHVQGFDAGLCTNQPV